MISPHEIRQVASSLGISAAEAEYLLLFGTPANLAVNLSAGAWQRADHLSVISNAVVEAVVGTRKRKIIEVPPRHGKSRLISVWTPVWFLNRFPDRNVILVSYALDLAAEFGREVRNIVMENEDTLNVRIAKDSQRADRWKTTAGGGMVSAGAGGPITGKGAHLLIVDDPIKNDEEANSQTMRDKLWEWWRSTVATRVEPGGAVVVLHTRWHTDDLIGRLLHEQPDRWDRIRIPARSEGEGDPLGRPEGAALWPERYPEPVLEEIEESVGPYWWGCTPGETPILMADWRTKPISEVRPGDQVIGFERGTPKSRARLVVSTVEHVMHKPGCVWTLDMESGRRVRCTSDHRWYTGRGPSASEPSRKTYDTPAVGRRLMYVCPPEDACTPEEERLWWYLAGIIDGEGSIKQHGVCVVSQSPTSNPDVYAKIINTLDRLGIRYTARTRTATNPHWGDRGEIVIHDIDDVYRRLLRFTEPGKKDQILQRMLARGHKFIRDEDAVVTIHSPSDEEVWALQTTTGNYIAWGYASSNSLYQQNPITKDGGLFSRDWFDLIHPDAVPESGETVRFWDMASTDSAGDYTAGVKVRRAKDGMLYVMDVVRWRKSPGESLRLMAQVAEADGLDTLHYVEQEPGASGVYHVNQVAKELDQWRVRGFRATGKKESYWDAASAKAEARRIKVVKAKWNSEFFMEIESCPVGKYDDQADAFGKAIACLVKKARWGVMRSDERPAIVEESPTEHRRTGETISIATGERMDRAG